MSNGDKNPSSADTPIEAARYFRSSTGRDSTDLVIDHILDSLLTGAMQPGERLNARKLVGELDVSVVPVREAIHFLAGEGVVELLPLKGAKIREMNADEIVDWWHVLRVITNLSFEAAARRIVSNSASTVLIRNALAAIEHTENSKDPITYLLSLVEFHRAVTQIGEQPVLDEAIRRLQTVYWLTFLPRYISFDVYGTDFTKNYHHVGEALMRGDGESAASIFNHHVAWSSAIISGERPKPGSAWRAKV